MTVLNTFTINKKNLISGKFVDINANVNQDISIYKMKPNQKEVFTKYKNSQYFILSEPPGSGKSTTIRFVANKLLQENPNLKVVIAVPQTLISRTFNKTFLEYPDGNQSEWDIGHNLCDSTSNQNKLLRLRNFLTKEKFSNDPSDRVSLVTHQTLSRLSTKINFDNTMLVVDEGHHVLYPENGELETANQIGKIVGQIMNQDNPNVGVWFATATFFRGDKSPIIPYVEMSRFTSYYLPLDIYWENYIEHIQTFSYNFVIYKENDVFNEAKEILKTNKRKTIIYCPYNGNLIEGSNKIQFRNRLINEIRSVWPNCRILDLVDEDGRLERKQVVIDNTDEFDIVLAAKLFDEGTDWPPASQIIDLYPSNSLRIQLQRLGRALRDIPGKDRVDYYVFFPFKARFKNEEDRRVHLSKNLNALIASSLLHDTIEPIPYLYSGTVTRKKDKSSNINQVDPFTREVPEESRKQEILTIIIKNLIFLKNINENPNTEECIMNTLRDFGVKNSLKEVAVHIAKILRRITSPRNPKWDQKTLDISWMVESGFDKVWSDDIYSGILLFTTKSCGISTFKEFREVYSSQKTPEEWVKIAENLARENGGILPNSGYLSKNHSSLESCMSRYPKLFQHIPQKKFFNTPEEWVKIAENLARENGGILSNTSTMRKKYAGLVSYMYSHPVLFKHIPQEKSFNTPEEWVKIAENLARENGGILPKIPTMNKEFSSLSRYIYKRPELFKGMKKFYGKSNKIITIGEREKGSHRTIEEWITIAGKLVEENDGVLPRITNIPKHYSGLVSCIYANPESFKGTKQYLGSKNKIRIIGEE